MRRGHSNEVQLNDNLTNLNGHGLIDPRLLEMLVCPISRDTLVYNSGTKELHSSNARLAYPVRDGIPIMLVDEARQISD